MDKHQPWRPHIKNAPLLNPFESSTEWTAQLGDADRIEIEGDEETTEDGAPAAPSTETSGKK
jgi:hypothetical protein